MVKAQEGEVVTRTLQLLPQSKNIHLSDSVSGQAYFSYERKRRLSYAEDYVAIREQFEGVRIVALPHVVIPDGIGVAISEKAG